MPITFLKRFYRVDRKLLVEDIWGKLEINMLKNVIVRGAREHTQKVKLFGRSLAINEEKRKC